MPELPHSFMRGGVRSAPSPRRLPPGTPVRRMVTGGNSSHRGGEMFRSANAFALAWPETRPDAGHGAGRLLCALQPSRGSRPRSPRRRARIRPGGRCIYAGRNAIPSLRSTSRASQRHSRHLTGLFHRLAHPMNTAFPCQLSERVTMASAQRLRDVGAVAAVHERRLVTGDPVADCPPQTTPHHGAPSTADRHALASRDGSIQNAASIHSPFWPIWRGEPVRRRGAKARSIWLPLRLLLAYTVVLGRGCGPSSDPLDQGRLAYSLTET